MSFPVVWNVVCLKDRAQDVRVVVDELRRRGLRRYL